METLNKNKKYEVHPDDLDVRGWDAVAEGIKLGIVNDLVLDTSRMRVKYLDVLRKDNVNDKNYHYLVPLNYMNFNRNNETVIIDANSHHFLNNYPGFTNEVPNDYEEKVRKYYSDTSSSREYSDRYSGRRGDQVIYEDKHDEIAADTQAKSSYGYEYEGMKNQPESWQEKINALEKQKQIKQVNKLELERDIALINEEIIKLKARLK